MKKIISVFLCVVLFALTSIVPVSAVRVGDPITGTVGNYSCGGFLWDGSGYNANTWVSSGARGSVQEIYAWIRCRFSSSDKPEDETKSNTANSIDIDATVNRSDQALYLYGRHYVVLTTGDNWNRTDYTNNETWHGY